MVHQYWVLLVLVHICVGLGFDKFMYTKPKKKRKLLPLMLITANYFPLTFQTDFVYFRNGDAQGDNI